jgi:hypothetical protein
MLVLRGKDADRGASSPGRGGMLPHTMAMLLGITVLCVSGDLEVVRRAWGSGTSWPPACSLPVATVSTAKPDHMPILAMPIRDPAMCLEVSDAQLRRDPGFAWAQSSP